MLGKPPLATIAVAALGTTGAVARLLNDTEAIKTQQVTPADPAQVAPADPTTAPSGQGSSAGESGYSSPAGIPADPTTNENQQPGMSPQNPPIQRQATSRTHAFLPQHRERALQRLDRLADRKSRFKKRERFRAPFGTFSIAPVKDLGVRILVTNDIHSPRARLRTIALSTIRSDATSMSCRLPWHGYRASHNRNRSIRS